MDRNGTLSSAVATGRLGVVGAWLMVLYVVTIATAIMAFSGFQFQAALGSVEASGHALTIGELESEHKSFAAKQELINALRKNVSTLEADLLRVAEEKNQILREFLANHADAQRVRAEITVAVQSLASVPDNATNVEELKEPIFSDTFPDLLRYLATLIANTGDDNPARPELERLLDEAKRILNNGYFGEARQNAILQQSDDLGKRVEDEQNKLVSVTSESLPRPELIGLFQQVEFFDGVPFGFGRIFRTMPPALLIPIVTLAMGALGSVIYLSVSVVVGEPPRPLAWYLFRPMLGMVTAFAVFILVQAGALVVTRPPAEGGDPGQLNPYFIAFVAIISGLLSEQAVERIRGVGGSFFSARDGEAPEVREQRIVDDQTTETR